MQKEIKDQWGNTIQVTVIDHGGLYPERVRTQYGQTLVRNVHGTYMPE